MKNKIYKSLLALFLVISLCTLTACGHGGGGSNSSSGGGSSQPSEQQTSYESVQLNTNLTSVVNNLNTLILPSANYRASIGVSNNLKEKATGSDLKSLIYPTTDLESFKTNTKITNQNTIGDNLCYGNKDGFRVALFSETDGSNNTITFIAADTTGLVAASYYYIGKECKSTFCYAVDKDGTFKGKFFKGEDKGSNFESEKNYNSTISGDKNSIIYVNNETGEQLSFDPKTGKEEDMSAAIAKLPIFEKHAVGAIVDPIIKYKDFLFTNSANSQRASVIPESYDLKIPDSLKNYLTVAAIDKVIPHNKVGDFIHDWATPMQGGSAHPNMHERKFWRDKVGNENDNITNAGPMYMKMATCPGNEMTDSSNKSVGLPSNIKLAMVCIYSNIEDGKGFGKTPKTSAFGEGEDNSNIRCKIITDTNSNYAVGYCHINNGYDGGGYETEHHIQTTFVFVMRTDGKKIVGRIFDGNRTDSISYNYEKGAVAKVYGDNVKYTYAPVGGTEETMDYQWDKIDKPVYTNQSDD